jgi:hypothetical protein
MTGLSSPGLPGILRAWPDGVPALEFAERECADPASPLFGVDQPLSLRATKPALYRVADSSLRFYLAIGRAAHDLSKRGRAEAAADLTW